MQEQVDDFLMHLRLERGLAEHTQRTYAALLGALLCSHAFADSPFPGRPGDNQGSWPRQRAASTP